MEPPPLAKRTPRKLRKRGCFGTGDSPSSPSSSFMDSEVVEITGPIFRNSKSHTQKEVIIHEVIDIDKDDDSNVMVIDDKVNTSNKGKGIKFSDGSGNHQAKDASPGSHKLTNLDGNSSDSLFGDEFFYLYNDDIKDVDRYAILEAYFDNVNIPPGVEASFPLFPGPAQIRRKPATGASSFYAKSQMQLYNVGLTNVLDPYPSFSSSVTAQFNLNSTLASSSNLQTQLKAVSHPPRVELSSPLSLPQASQRKKKSAGMQHRGNALNIPFQVESSTEAPLGSEPPLWGHFKDQLKKLHTANELLQSRLSSFPAQAGKVNHPPGIEPSVSWWKASSNYKMTPSYKDATQSSFLSPHFEDVHIPSKQEAETLWFQDSTRYQTSLAAAGSSRSPFESISKSDMNGVEDITRKFQNFKQFDTVEDYSDHHYTCNASSMKQPSKNWAKRIQEEWKILEKDLPDTIFVRVYEARMELLRAVIIGAEGTPYHDGLFFFDVYFPCGYPNVPPHVYYHSGGLRLNPNLYNCGKVCLSLLNTWSGNKNEKWIPGVSTMLQVLVSIQGLILNQKPYFNEPGFADMSGSANGEIMSWQYNEDTFILSLKTMLYMIRRPPKHFEDFVVGHFCKRAHDILVACKAYTDGAQVGCLVKGGVQDVEMGDKSCSQNFKETLAGYVNTLVVDFTNIGAKDCEKFLSPAKKGNKPVPAKKGNKPAPGMPNLV